MAIILTLLLMTSDGQRTLPPTTAFEDVTADSDGQWITTIVTIDTAEDELDGRTFYGCFSDNEVSRSVCFKEFIDLDENVPHVVMGRLLIIHHGPSMNDGESFDGFTEYRLEREVLIRSQWW